MFGQIRVLRCNIFSNLTEHTLNIESKLNIDELKVLKKIKTCIYGNFSQKSKSYNKLKFYYNGEILQYTKDTNPITNYYMSSFITMKVRLKIHKIVTEFIKFNIKILSINIDSIFFFTSNNILNEFKLKNINLMSVWENREKYYKDVFFINHTYSFFQKVGTDSYSSNFNQTIEEEHIVSLKNKWYYSHDLSFKLKDWNIKFNSLNNRSWLPNRISTKAKVYKVKYPK